MRNRWFAAALLSAFCYASGIAQDKPASATTQEKPPAAPGVASPRPGVASLKVTVVISRFQGDKKISSLPYAFGVTSGGRTNLRMGSDVPIISRVQKAGPTEPGPSYNYRSVGTNIDCIADTGTNGVYGLTLTIEDSSVHLDPGQKGGSAAVIDDIPSFRSFRSSFTAIMRDGQTTQHTSATDPVTGEVTKIDLTLNVIK